MGAAGYTRARDRLLAADERDLGVREVCAELVLALHEVARFSAGAVMSVDPETLLPSGGVVEGFSPDDCGPFWDNELADPDFNKFTDLARRVDPVASLAEATDGELTRSPRVAKLYAPAGLADELRAVFVAGGSCLAIASLTRAATDGPFTAEELADVRALVPVAIAGLRRAHGRVVEAAATHAPVVILLDEHGRVAGMSAGGEQVLDDLRINGIDGDFPGIVHVAAAKARWSRGSSELTTRLRGRSGRWMRLHVAAMEGDRGSVALTVEPARPDDLVRILLDSYGLTSRETEIVIRLARGLTSKEIAAELFISAHTVRDHVKAIYEKAGVNSRGELVAGLFTAHVLERFHGEVAHVTGRVSQPTPASDVNAERPRSPSSVAAAREVTPR